MQSDPLQPSRRQSVLHSAGTALLLALTVLAVVAVASADVPGPAPSMPESGLTPVSGGRAGLQPDPIAAVSQPEPQGEPTTVAPRPAGLQAGKIWDLVEVQLEVWEDSRQVLTRTLGLGPADISHVYNTNLWGSNWPVTGTARLNVSAHADPPLTMREGEVAVFPLSGVFGVEIQEPERTSWGDYYHGSELIWLGSYWVCGRHSNSKGEYMAAPSHSASLQANCYYTPTTYVANSFDVVFMAKSSLGWRANSSRRVWFTARYSYRVRPADRVTVALGGQVKVTSVFPFPPLVGVPVTLMRNGKPLLQAVTQGPNGVYSMPQAPITDSLVLSVTLQHAAASPPAFRVIYNQTPAAPLVYVATQPFALNGASAAVTKDIAFSQSPGIATSPVISPAHLADLGIIYHHVYQAWQLTSQLGQTLDNRLPLDIKAYSTESSVFWTGPGSNGSGSGVDPIINIEAASSSVVDGGRPDNREWHEFGHAVMADAYDNLMPKSTLSCHAPQQPGDDCNHGGYKNATTTDSWIEGFAEFFSMMVGRDIQRKLRPELYRAHGSSLNLEANYLAWTQQITPTPGLRQFEELAVAGLLLDLVDSADADDATFFTTGGPTYADCVQTDLPRLWSIISRPWGGTVAGSPLAPPTYTYIFDVKHLYDVLKHEGIGAASSRGRALSDLDELFVAHGFFKDSNGNRRYDAGEPVGWSGHVGVPGISDRPDRRSSPPITGSYIAYQARARQTGAAVAVQSVGVDVRFPPPYEHLSYSYTEPLQETGRIYYVAPDAQYGAVAHIRVWAPGWVSTQALSVPSALYWERMAAEPQHHFVDHVFEMSRTVSVYLPLIVSGYGAAASSLDVTGQSMIAAAARTPRACAPDVVATATGTVTRTPTRTATPTVTQTGSVSGTATRTVTRTPTRTATPTATRTGSVSGTATSTATRTVTPTATRTASRTVTPTAARTATPAGINGRVTYNGAASVGRTLELRKWNGSAFVLQATTTTGADGRYNFTGIPALTAGNSYYVRYLNAPTAPNPGAGYLWWWFGSNITSYTAGAMRAGGDFDIADVTMTLPAEGASVTLPATFCWSKRGDVSDNYRLIFRNQSTGVDAPSQYLGYADCATVSAIPADWPSGATYTWWVRVHKGANPDATPYNYGDPSTTKSVRIYK